MSTYVADKRLQWARGLPVFIAVLAFARFRKVKFLRSFIKRNISMTVGRIFTKNIYLYIFILVFFRKPEKLGSHTGSK